MHRKEAGLPLFDPPCPTAVSDKRNINPRLSPITYHLSPTVPPTTYHLQYHLSPITHHSSPTTHHLPRITRHLLPLPLPLRPENLLRLPTYAETYQIHLYLPKVRDPKAPRILSCTAHFGFLQVGMSTFIFILILIQERCTL